jgi:hypothetical protein
MAAIHATNLVTRVAAAGGDRYGDEHSFVCSCGFECLTWYDDADAAELTRLSHEGCFNTCGVTPMTRGRCELLEGHPGAHRFPPVEYVWED